MSKRIALALIAAAVAWAGLSSLLRPLEAQSATARTSNGLLVEQIQVGGSCVVIVSRGGPGDSNLAAVPCK